MKERKPEYSEKTPGDELQKMLHTKARRFKPQARLEPAQQHWWRARKADVLTVTPRVAPNRITTLVVVCWLLNVPATCECISGTDLRRQFDVLPH